jgi:glycosyltransferase involved in cell wall biosynthesis
MRIALISTCALATPPKRYGGTELMVSELAKGLLGLGHEVTLFATEDSNTPAQLRAFGPPAWPPNELAELRHAGFAWREIATASPKFDIVHAHHGAALPYHLMVGLPCVFTVHHERVPELITHYRAFPRVAYVAISRRQAELSPELTFARAIHHGLDPNAYSASARDAGYVAFLGRFAPEKAPHVAIDAARMAGVPIQLGGAPHEIAAAQHYFEREMKARLADPDNRATWCGELDHAAKVRLLVGARALLVPLAWEEPFGLVMIEAMLLGIPVIAFRRGSAPEVVEEGVTGFLVRDTQEMAERIRALDRFDRARCRARARERFCSRRMAQEYSQLYLELVKAHRRRASARRYAMYLQLPHFYHAGNEAKHGAEEQRR